MMMFGGGGNAMANHPYYQKFQERFYVVLNNLVNSGQLNPVVAQIINNQMIPQLRTGIMSFVSSLMQMYPREITDDNVDQAIMQRFLPPLVQRANMMAMANGGCGGGMMGFGGGMAGGFGGGNPGMMGFGGSGMIGAQPQINRQPMNGLFGGSTVGNAQPIKPVTPAQPQQPAKPTGSPAWSVPKQTSAIQKKLNGDKVVVDIARFKLYDGSNATRILVSDPRIRYKNDYEALDAYKSLFGVIGEQNKKFLTVAYQKLIVLNAGRNDFARLANTVSGEVSKVSGVEAKLRAIISSIRPFGMDCVMEFTNLFLQELFLHTQVGELADHEHPKNLLGLFHTIDDVLRLVTGDIDKDMMNVLNNMRGFKERLPRLLNGLITYICQKLPQLIIDPMRNLTTIDDYTRCLPSAWSTDGGVTLKGVDDLFEIFLTSKQTISGSITESANKADSQLSAATAELDKHFTMIHLPRIASWCNYFRGTAVSYDKGNCVPKVFKDESTMTSDIAYFTAEVVNTFNLSSDVRYRTAPKTVYCECDEDVSALQYGVTTDDWVWLGVSKYWHK